MGNIIELKDVQIYQQSELVLSDINFDVNDNDLVYLIGKTGSGKSSLLKTLYGELLLKHGKGSVSGVDLRTLGRKDIPMLDG